jgi:hypothetical protein
MTRRLKQQCGTRRNITCHYGRDVGHGAASLVTMGAMRDTAQHHSSLRARCDTHRRVHPSRREKSVLSDTAQLAKPSLDNRGQPRAIEAMPASVTDEQKSKHKSSSWRQRRATAWSPLSSTRLHTCTALIIRAASELVSGLVSGWRSVCVYVCVCVCVCVCVRARACVCGSCAC